MNVFDYTKTGNFEDNDSKNQTTKTHCAAL